jgi:hypothetical protein
MRVASSRVATVAMVLVGLAALVLAGRLVRTTSSAGRPATSAAVTIPPAATATTLDSVEVPDAVGQTLAQAKMVVDAAGLRGAADNRDPQVPKAAGGQVRCVVRFGVVDAGGELGIWTAKVAKHSSPPAVMEVTVRFARLWG